MAVTYQQIPNGASWVVMGTTTPAAFDARFDADGTTVWIFQQLGNGWAHYTIAGMVLIAQGNFFSNTTSQQVVQHDEGIMLWGQDDASHYFVCDTSHLYKLDSSMATVATLALNTLTPDGTIDAAETYKWEDLICFKSGSTNYVAIVSTITISPDVFQSGIIWIINADTMAFVGSYASRPTSNSHYGWKAWGDKNGDIWCFVQNDDTSGANLIRWHPADGVSGTTLVVTNTPISSTTIGSTFPFAFSQYDTTNHSVILFAYGNAITDNSVLSAIDLTGFTQLVYRADDGKVGYQGHIDGEASASEVTAKCTLACLGDANPETHYPGGVLQLLDPATLIISDTFDIAAGINAAAVGTLWQGNLDLDGPAYAGAWVFDAGTGTMLAGFSNLGVSSAVYYVTGLTVFSACGAVQDFTVPGISLGASGSPATIKAIPQGAKLDLGQALKDLNTKDPSLGNALRRIQEAINSLGDNLSASPIGNIPQPPTPQAINVKVAGELLHVSIDHHGPLQKGVNYFTEIATDAAFSNPIIHHHGPSRTSPPISLPTKDDDGNTVNYYVRSYAQYRGSKPSAPVVHGGNAPTAINMTGTTQMTLLTSSGSGTAASDGQQGGQGYGVDLFRRTGPKRSDMNE